MLHGHARAREGRGDVLRRQRRLDLGRILAIRGIERRRTEVLHLALHRLLERRVAEQVRDRADDLRVHLRLGHQGRAVGDLPHALDQGTHARQVARADGVAHLRRRLHHVGRDAAGIEHGVVDARVGRHVLAHVVDADVHQLHRVERAAAEMRRRRGVRGAALEGEVDARVGEAHGVVDAVDGGRMPGDGDVDVLEVAGAHHEDLGRAAFLGRAAVVAHAALDASLRRGSS